MWNSCKWLKPKLSFSSCILKRVLLLRLLHAELFSKFTVYFHWNVFWLSSDWFKFLIRCGYVCAALTESKTVFSPSFFPVCLFTRGRFALELWKRLLQCKKNTYYSAVPLSVHRLKPLQKTRLRWNKWCNTNDSVSSSCCVVAGSAAPRFVVA